MVVTVAMILLSVAPGVVFPWKVGVMGANSENLVSNLIPRTSNGFSQCLVPCISVPTYCMFTMAEQERILGTFDLAI